MLSDAASVFLFDVDNTLLDNDTFAADLGAHLQRTFGLTERERYWTLYAQVRKELGRADYLATLQAFRSGLEGNPRLLEMSSFLLDYPFASRLYPQALDVLRYIAGFGQTVILSDGDIVFQPRKIQRSGLWDAVDGRVLIERNKEHTLAEMQERYPARHYVAIDDKPLLLAKMKRVLGDTLTTVFVRQGHYAAESADALIEPAPDRCIGLIAELLRFDVASFFSAPARPIRPRHDPHAVRQS